MSTVRFYILSVSGPDGWNHQIVNDYVLMKYKNIYFQDIPIIPFYDTRIYLVITKINEDISNLTSDLSWDRFRCTIELQTNYTVTPNSILSFGKYPAEFPPTIRDCFKLANISLERNRYCSEYDYDHHYKEYLYLIFREIEGVAPNIGNWSSGLKLEDIVKRIFTHTDDGDKYYSVMVKTEIPDHLCRLFPTEKDIYIFERNPTVIDDVGNPLDSRVDYRGRYFFISIVRNRDERYCAPWSISFPMLLTQCKDTKVLASDYIDSIKQPTYNKYSILYTTNKDLSIIDNTDQDLCDVKYVMRNIQLKSLVNRFDRYISIIQVCGIYESQYRLVEDFLSNYEDVHLMKRIAGIKSTEYCSAVYMVVGNNNYLKYILTSNLFSWKELYRINLNLVQPNDDDGSLASSPSIAQLIKVKKNLNYVEFEKSISYRSKHFYKLDAIPMKDDSELYIIIVPKNRLRKLNNIVSHNRKTKFQEQIQLPPKLNPLSINSERYPLRYNFDRLMQQIKIRFGNGTNTCPALIHIAGPYGWNSQSIESFLTQTCKSIIFARIYRQESIDRWVIVTYILVGTPNDIRLAIAYNEHPTNRLNIIETAI